jgi:hypothetical protein
MKKQLLHMATALSLCLMLGVAATAQMTRQMTLTVPFDFYVGKTALPAGTYTVYSTGTKAGDGFLLRGAGGHLSVAFNAQQVQSGKAQSVARLEFRRYSDKYFLASVWAEGNNIGRELQKSGLERETVRNVQRDLAKKDVTPEVVTLKAE